jgi:trehalose/maltose transport system permease protein
MLKKETDAYKKESSKQTRTLCRMQVPGVTSLVLSARGRHSRFQSVPVFLGTCRIAPARQRTFFDRSFAQGAYFDHYYEIFKRPIFVESLINSAIVAGSTVLISLGFGSLSAYALARLPFRFKGSLLYIVLLMSNFPVISLLPGLFVMLRNLGLFNTRHGLVLTYLAFTIPFVIWVMTQHFRSVSRDLEDAVYVDGASPLIVYWRILLPLAMPGLVSSGLLAFIGAFNEFLFALTFTISDDLKTVPVVITQFGGQYEAAWGPILAASMVMTIPLVTLVIIFQHRILKGFTAGSWK